MDNEKFHYEQYAEEQFERVANGMEEETFVEWKKRRQAMADILNQKSVKSEIIHVHSD